MTKSKSGISYPPQWFKNRFDVETMSDYTGIRQRFIQGFADFIITKKQEAIHRILSDEILNETLVNCRNFSAAILRCLENEALAEQRFIFLSVNPKMLI